MSVSLRRNADEKPQAPLQKDPRKDIYDIVARMLIGLVMNYLVRKLRSKGEMARDRKEAARKVAKLQKKGKEVPAALAKDAVEGLSRAKKKKLAKDKEKAAKKSKGKKAEKAKKKKVGKLVWLVALVAAIVLIARAAGKK